MPKYIKNIRIKKIKNNTQNKMKKKSKKFHF